MRKLPIFILLFLLYVSCQNDAGKKPTLLDTLAAKRAEIDSLGENPTGFDAIVQRKKKGGVDFYALGQEPGWSLDLDFEKNFSFSSYEGTQLTAPAMAADIQGNLSKYRTYTDEGEMIIQVRTEECFDSMSGQKYTHSVTVIIKTANATEPKIFKGCGSLLN